MSMIMIMIMIMSMSMSMNIYMLTYRTFFMFVCYLAGLQNWKI
jgi:hypothetical protein